MSAARVGVVVAIVVCVAALLAMLVVMRGTRGEFEHASAVAVAPRSEAAASIAPDSARRIDESDAPLDRRDAEETPRAAGAGDASPWMIRGRVVEDIGGPIAGASVWLYRDRKKIVQTDANGRFAIRSDVRESDTVYAVAPGYASESGDARSDVLARPDEPDHELIVVMTRAGSIRGRVTEESGAFVREVVLCAFAGDLGAGPHSMTGRAPDGTFEIRSLPSRYHYRVVAIAEGYASAERAAVPIGAEDVELVLRPMRRLRVAVRDAADGSPLRRFAVSARKADEAIVWSGQAHDDGTGDVECREPGDVLLTISAAGYLPVNPPAIHVDGRADVGPIPIAMVRRPTAPEIVRRGIVRNARDGSIVGDFAANVVATANASIDDGDDETGEFVCRFEEEGRCEVEVTSAGFEPRRLPMAASAADAAAPPVEFRLEPSPPDSAFATITGRVTIDGQPEASLVVRLVGGESLTFTNAAGDYRLSRVPPGDTTIEVGFERGCSTIATRAAHVPAGETSTLDVRIATGDVDVSLRGTPGDAPVDAIITAVELSDHELLERASWTGVARATLSKVPAGDWLVRVDAGSLGLLARRVTVVPHAITPLTFDLRTPGSATIALARFDGTRRIDFDLSLDAAFVLHRSITTASFDLPALAPGDYTLTARARAVASDDSVDLGTTSFVVRSGEATRVRVDVGNR